MDNEENARQLFEKIHALIVNARFKEALPQAKLIVKQLPDEPYSYETLAVVYNGLRRNREAIAVLEKAVMQFPDDHGVVRVFGEILMDEGQFDRAEEKLRQALSLMPPDEAELRGATYNLLGIAMWEQSKRDDALQAWKDALAENPDDQEARANLDEYTNEYAEPKAPSDLFDDLYHFQRMHIDRWERDHPGESAHTPEHFQNVFAHIADAWNSTIAPLRDRLDAMTAAEKSALFGSVTIDYAAPVQEPVLEPPPEATMEGDAMRGIKLTPREKKILADLKERFPYLSAAEGFYMLYAIPALIAAGIDAGRIWEIIDQKDPTPEELDIIHWAIEVTSLTMDAGEVKSPEEILALVKAFDIAADRIEEDDAAWVLQELREYAKESRRRARRAVARKQKGKKKRK